MKNIFNNIEGGNRRIDRVRFQPDRVDNGPGNVGQNGAGGGQFPEDC